MTETPTPPNDPQPHEDTINDPDPDQLTPAEEADATPINPEGLDEMVEADKTNADPDTPKTADEAEAKEAEAGGGEAEEADGSE